MIAKQIAKQGVMLVVAMGGVLSACGGATDGAASGERSAESREAMGAPGTTPWYPSTCLPSVPVSVDWDGTAYNPWYGVWVQLSGFPGGFGVYALYDTTSPDPHYGPEFLWTVYVSPEQAGDFALTNPVCPTSWIAGQAPADDPKKGIRNEAPVCVQEDEWNGLYLNAIARCAPPPVYFPFGGLK